MSLPGGYAFRQVDVNSLFETQVSAGGYHREAQCRAHPGAVPGTWEERGGTHSESGLVPRLGHKLSQSLGHSEPVRL